MELGPLLTKPDLMMRAAADRDKNLSRFHRRQNRAQPTQIWDFCQGACGLCNESAIRRYRSITTPKSSVRKCAVSVCVCVRVLCRDGEGAEPLYDVVADEVCSVIRTNDSNTFRQRNTVRLSTSFRDCSRQQQAVFSRVRLIEWWVDCVCWNVIRRVVCCCTDCSEEQVYRYGTASHLLFPYQLILAVRNAPSMFGNVPVIIHGDANEMYKMYDPGTTAEHSMLISKLVQ